MLGKRITDRFYDIFGQTTRNQIIKGISNKFTPFLIKNIGQLLGHILDVASPVEDNQQGTVRRQHDGIQDSILLDAAGLIGNHEQVADTSVVFHQQLKEYIPPGFFSVWAGNLHNGLAFAGV